MWVPTAAPSACAGICGSYAKDRFKESRNRQSRRRIHAPNRQPGSVVKRTIVFAVVSMPCLGYMGIASAAADWTFIVSGDSRNCGDVVLPSIAAAAHERRAAFYWHLGDLRWMVEVDEDYKAIHPRTNLKHYLGTAWDDFVENQIGPFGDTPFFVGIGNHETILPGMRSKFVRKFAPWLDVPVLRQQRLLDDPQDVNPHTYYHWHRDGIDFIYLDNASFLQFDRRQRRWLRRVLQHDAAAADVTAVVVGMHKALPDSVAAGHSMNESPIGTSTGREVYAQLLDLQRSKPVYVLASHSHYYMSGIYDTPYWRAHGGGLAGWIVRTGGARRYPLPQEQFAKHDHRAHAYGYFMARVKPAAAAQRIEFSFVEVSEPEVPSPVTQRFGSTLVHQCYAGNP